MSKNWNLNDSLEVKLERRKILKSKCIRRSALLPPALDTEMVKISHEMGLSLVDYMNEAIANYNAVNRK